FDRFGRVDDARTRTQGGVGLGLAIVDAIARAHGGSCTVSLRERGSAFALRLAGFHSVRPDSMRVAAGRLRSDPSSARASREP
ncbi:MAG: ATP-binding protein, partial [Gaiellaceae bacterium]